jgi:hypothetical protein
MCEINAMRDEFKFSQQTGLSSIVAKYLSQNTKGLTSKEAVQ